jgi:hypothetical protein
MYLAFDALKFALEKLLYLAKIIGGGGVKLKNVTNFKNLITPL